ncbi:serine hydrolase [Fodinicola acaciae]|uniref:serine hydrolase n=1 Tax=Fodinicola acaciae TaxID=2681555 RepID=UPI0013D352D0|nr:serine hydrolase [Fodinicola acaciae]
MKSHRRRLPWYGVAAAATVAALVATGVVVAGIGNASAETTGGQSWRNARLAAQLRAAVAQQDWKNVLDTTPPGSTAARLVGKTQAEKDGAEPSPAQVMQRLRTLATAQATPAPIHQNPQLDAAVIELDSAGRPIAAADVVMSPQYPTGKIVPLDANLSTDQVRYRAWDDDTWDNNNGQGVKDAIPGRENAPIDFMSPYPASVFKMMVGFGVLQLVDKGEISLDDQYAYDPTGAPSTSSCGGKVTKPIRQFFDEMITVSRNESACAMVKLLHQHNYVTGLNDYFAGIGLPMLQINGTRPVDGGRWVDNIMSALDTAKLFLILNGTPGTLWKAPDGTPVTRDALSATSRAFFLKELNEQALNQALSTTNWCGRAYPAPGIPQRISDRWINPADGTVTAAGRVYGQDVRPCQAAAQVNFAHKTGFVDTSGNDAGIVDSLPGKTRRHYIIAVHCNLGNRYIDPNRPADPPGIYPVQYSEKYGLFGKAVDTIVTGHHNP